MNKAFEKIMERLEERTSFLSDCTKYGNKDAKQLGGTSADYIRYWMPRPEPPKECERRNE